MLNLIKKRIIFIFAVMFLFNYTFGYSVTMCDDNSYNVDTIYGSYIGISVWDAQWSTNKQFIASTGNCIYVSGLSGGDFVQFGKYFIPKVFANKNQSNSLNNVPKMNENNVTSDGTWCMSSNATTIQGSGIETTTAWRFLDSGYCVKFGAGQDWHDSIWNIQPQNTGGEGEQRQAIGSNSFVGLFQTVQLSNMETYPHDPLDNVQLIGDGDYSQNVNSSNGQFSIASNPTTSDQLYYVEEPNVILSDATYTFKSFVYKAPLIVDTELNDREGLQYLCVNSDEVPNVNWTITPEVTPSNDNYQETVYSFNYTDGNNCYSDL